MLRIDRCVCVNVGFDELLAASRAESLDQDALERRFGCCRGCGLCAPYVRRMLRTGETSFNVLLTDPDEPAPA